jgi:hypothetical protein
MSSKIQVSLKSQSLLYIEVWKEHFYPLDVCVSQTLFEFRVLRKISELKRDEVMGMEEAAS